MPKYVQNLSMLCATECCTSENNPQKRLRCIGLSAFLSMVYIPGS